MIYKTESAIEESDANEACKQFGHKPMEDSDRPGSFGEMTQPEYSPKCARCKKKLV